ncbi:MAG TPA: DUF523 and DUF1722 domain-containing protein, partial [Acidobacteriota bacterium]|nr:DUF523 and DUF1722 domain-containing protein [Acidobacteriota bacterium]
YILKSDSPSCGLSGVKVHRIPYPPVRRGRGVFAAALSSRFPSLPVEEAERLRNPAIKENFIERMFAFYRFQTFLKTRPAADDLLTFHNNSKMTLLAHSPAHYERLSLLAASAGEDFPTTLELYRLLYMEALEIKATRRRHASVLRQLARHIARDVDAADRAEITAAIDNYRRGLVSFAVPLTLLRREFELHPIDWIVSQTYLNPYPAELALRG